jgi:TM2 domain-containing membrane protein YozV
LRSAIYSLVFPGLGQLNNGDMSRGLLFFAIAFILILSLHLGVTLIILVLFWIYNIYDAYSGAKKLP